MRILLIGTYTSDRTWMVILAGAFYLGHRTPGVAAMLTEGERIKNLLGNRAFVNPLAPG